MEIAVVVVIYNMPINESKTLNSIKSIAVNVDLSDFKFFIYDNSTNEQSIQNVTTLNAHYYHNKDNGGLSDAYNYVLNICDEKQIPWLLLLDHDTTLTPDFFSEIKSTLPIIQEDKNVVAVIPKIVCNKKIVSPVILNKGGFTREIKKDNYGVLNYPITGINSGTILRVDFINAIGGFNPIFKVDMLDYWYFKMIDTYKKNSYILKSTLQHDLSVMNYQENITTERYNNIIKAEKDFFKNYTSTIDFIVFKLRLTLRLIKQLIKVKNKKIAWITFYYVLFK